jgi:hypothetical protein
MTASSLTRRQALQLGAASGLAALLGGPAVARAGTAPALRRSSWAPLVSQPVRAGAVTLRLERVADLAGAAGDAALRDHDEAFALTFTGPAGALADGAHVFAHPALGSFALFAAPVGSPAGGSQHYEAVVDRSVGRTADPPAAPKPDVDPTERPGSPEAAATALEEYRAEVARQAGALQRRAVRRRRRARLRAARRRRAGRRRLRAVDRRARAGRRTRARHLAVRRGGSRLVP